MSKFISLITVFVALVFSAQAHAETILKCAVNNVVGYEGARVNVIKNAKGEVRANLIFGTTVSGTMYSVSEIAPGIFQGAIKGKGKEKFWIKLFVSGAVAENKSIRGGKSQLEVVYPTTLVKSGMGHFKSFEKDNFVCGEQFRPFRK
jgi:hypothetical protein